MLKLRLLLPLLALLAIMAILPFSCASRYPLRDPTGESFPAVEGESLEGARVRLPEDLAGAPAILLVGYEQETQFDIDRWLLGLIDSGTKARILELPTIPGLGARLAAPFIDRGMRSGIPRRDWSSVVTIYGDGDRVTRFTGNENPRPARVMLIDTEGRVRWFHDEGYSPASLRALTRLLAESN